MLAGVLLTGTEPETTPVLAAMPPLEYRLDIRMARGEVYNPWTLSNEPVELRSFQGAGIEEGAFVGPEMRVRPGQRLRVAIDNQLPACPDGAGAVPCYNDTNLHTHGLWVSPAGNSDNVMITVRPGERFQYEYDIPVDHPAGTFWYHPHQHGNGNVQVGSGMAGPLIVTGDRAPTLTTPGDIDILLRDERGAFAERVLLFQQIHYGCYDASGEVKGRMVDGVYIRPWVCEPGETGRLDRNDQDWDWENSGRFTGINGRVQPALTGAVAGRFERWRMIQGTPHEAVRMRLYRLAEDAPDLRTVTGEGQAEWRIRNCLGAPLQMWQIAADGLTGEQVRPTDEAVLFPGERVDVLTWFPVAGRYCVVHDTTRTTSTDDPSRMLAVLEVGDGEGTAPAVDPTAQLQARLIAAAEQVMSSPEQAAIRQAVVANLADGLKVPAFVWHPTVTPEEVTGYREILLSIVETPKDALFHINGRAYEHGRIDQFLPLGGVEEWYLTSVTASHPLHIHVNPFQIVSIVNAEGQAIADPASPGYDPDYAGLIGQWKDTLFVKEGYRAVVRTRFERFTGDFVMHCHILFHGDHGMMQHLRIFDPARPEVTEAPSHH